MPLLSRGGGGSGAGDSLQYLAAAVAAPWPPKASGSTGVSLLPWAAVAADHQTDPAAKESLTEMLDDLDGQGLQPGHGGWG